jgi:MoxR-like ATPase
MKIYKKVQTPLSDIIERFESGFEQVSKHLIGRAEEIEAFKLCLLCSGHLLLDGPPGSAKSKLARLGFKVIQNDDDSEESEQVNVFKIMMMPNTQAEDLFGPMNITKFREEAIIHYNTTRMLPEAHFAYIDEVFRGSDSVLSTTLGILNERYFFNGPVLQKCPLITAVGTTNFVSDSPELEAFLDRWLIRIKVRAADSKNSRQQILSIFLGEEDEDKIQITETITLKELLRLQAEVRKVVIPEMLLDMYEEVTEGYKLASPAGTYISDRRYCQAARLIQAAMLLNGGGNKIENPDPQAVTAARYAILRDQTKEHREAIEKSIANVVGNYEVAGKEEPGIVRYESVTEKLFRKYDDSLPKDKKEQMYKVVRELIEGIVAMPPEEKPTLPRNLKRMESVVGKLESLRKTLGSDLGITS